MATLKALGLLALAAHVGACRRHGSSEHRSAVTIAITVRWAGGSAGDVESAISNPIEDQVAQMSGLLQIRSTSRDGGAELMADFAPELDPLTAAQKVMSRLSAVSTQLPGDSEPPVVAVAMSRDAAALRFAATSNTLSLAVVGDYIQHELIRINQLDGVGRVELCGFADHQITVLLDVPSLGSYGVSVGDVASALRGIGSNGTVTSVDQLPPLVVALRNGSPVRLRDLAQVIDQPPPPPCAAVSSDGTAIEGIVYAQPGASSAEVRQRVEAVLPALRQAIPQGVDLKVLPDAPLALFAVTSADGDGIGAHLLEVRDAVIGAGATEVVVTQGGRPSELELTPNEIEIRAWPNTPERERAVRDRLAERSHVALEDSRPHVIAITGPELGALTRIARDVMVQLSSTPGLASLGTVDTQTPRYDIETDQARAAELGVQVADIAELGRIAVDGEEVSKLVAGPVRVPVMLRFLGAASDPAWVDAAYVRSANGVMIAVSGLVRVRTSASTTIRHVNRERWVGVRVSTRGNDAALAAVVAGLKLPPGYRASVK